MPEDNNINSNTAKLKKVKTFRILLSGRVQGVGYRYFAAENAERFNIKGYVRNTFDNKVEVVCQSEDIMNLELFVGKIKKGPSFSHVTDVLMEEITNLGLFDSFIIKY